MLKKIELADNFKRSFRRLPEQIRFQFSKKRLIFYQDPFSKSLRTHKLKGRLKNFWSFSVNYSYRVIFKFIDSDRVIFYDIGDHKIYK